MSIKEPLRSEQWFEEPHPGGKSQDAGARKKTESGQKLSKMTHNALEDINVIGQGLKHLFQHWHRRPSVFLHDVQDSGRPRAWNGFGKPERMCWDWWCPHPPHSSESCPAADPSAAQDEERDEPAQQAGQARGPEGKSTDQQEIWPGDGKRHAVRPTQVFIHYRCSFQLRGDGNSLCCCRCCCVSARGWGVCRAGEFLLDYLLTSCAFYLVLCRLCPGDWKEVSHQVPRGCGQR